MGGLCVQGCVMAKCHGSFLRERRDCLLAAWLAGWLALLDFEVTSTFFLRRLKKSLERAARIQLLRNSSLLKPVAGWLVFLSNKMMGSGDT